MPKPGWECLIVAVLTLHKPAKVEDTARFIASELSTPHVQPGHSRRISRVAIRDDEHLEGIREQTVVLPKIRRCCDSRRCNPLRSGAEFVVENSFDFLEIALFYECLSDCADLATCRIDCILYV